VRMPTRSIFGWNTEPSPRSTTIHHSPRQPRSPASATPTGPAPTTRISHSNKSGLAVIWIWFSQCIGFASCARGKRPVHLAILT